MALFLLGIAILGSSPKKGKKKEPQEQLSNEETNKHQGGGPQYDLTICTAVEQIAQMWPTHSDRLLMAAQKIRQAASDNALVIWGFTSADLPLEDEYNKIWQLIPATYWAEHEIDLTGCSEGGPGARSYNRNLTRDDLAQDTYEDLRTNNEQVRKLYDQLARSEHWLPMTDAEKRKFQLKLDNVGSRRGRVLFQPVYSCEILARDLSDCFTAIQWDVEISDQLYWPADKSGIQITAENDLAKTIRWALVNALGDKAVSKMKYEHPETNHDFQLILGKRPTK